MKIGTKGLPRGRRLFLAPAALLFLLGSGSVLRGEVERAPRLEARKGPRHVTLSWEGSEKDVFEVWRGKHVEGPFDLIRSRHLGTLYGECPDAGDGALHYRIRRVPRSRHRGGRDVNGPFSNVVSLSWEKGPISDEALLDALQEASIRYFVDYAHPDAGMARERRVRNDDPWYRSRGKAFDLKVFGECATGATGMGLFNLIVGVERGWIPREKAAALIVRILDFLSHKAARHRGAFGHWHDGRTGKVIEVFRNDDGADLVETAFLMQGLIAVREYFRGEHPQEETIRQGADRLWREMEWSAFVQGTGKDRHLRWHLSPDSGKRRNQTLGIKGPNETHIVYLLGAASPTHSIGDDVYQSGWVDGLAAHPPLTLYGHSIETGLGEGGGPLFFAHYSYLGFNPRGFGDRVVGDYHRHYRNLSLINRAYCLENPLGFTGYGEDLWGLTSSSCVGGYRNHAPLGFDNGTIAPTAALSSMPYVPEESMAVLRGLYTRHGARVWGEFGFLDAFNPDRDWVSDGYLGIDVGPIAPMIENHRTGLCWKLFMNAPEIRALVDRLGRRKK